MIWVIVVLLVVNSALLLGVIGLKTRLEDVQLLARSLREEFEEREKFHGERVRELLEHNNALNARLKPFAAHRVSR